MLLMIGQVAGTAGAVPISQVSYGDVLVRRPPDDVIESRCHMSTMTRFSFEGCQLSLNQSSCWMSLGVLSGFCCCWFSATGHQVSA